MKLILILINHKYIYKKVSRLVRLFNWHNPVKYLSIDPVRESESLF